MHALESILGYSFNNTTLLQKALTHPSCGKLDGGKPFNYQRLEFLGDAVLGLVMAELLFDAFTNEKEGSLAKRHAALVCGEAIYRVAASLGIEKFIIMSPSEEASGGRKNPTNIENACEALIGAVYLDGGLEPAKRFIVKHWKDMALSVAVPPRDAKTELQEWAQAEARPLPHYRILKQEGPSHAPIFSCEVSVDGFPAATASGGTKRTAEQLAARSLLNIIFPPESA